MRFLVSYRAPFWKCWASLKKTDFWRTKEPPWSLISFSNHISFHVPGICFRNCEDHLVQRHLWFRIMDSLYSKGDKDLALNQGKRLISRKAQSTYIWGKDPKASCEMPEHVEEGLATMLKGLNEEVQQLEAMVHGLHGGAYAKQELMFLDENALQRHVTEFTLRSPGNDFCDEREEDALDRCQAMFKESSSFIQTLGKDLTTMLCKTERLNKVLRRVKQTMAFDTVGETPVGTKTVIRSQHLNQRGVVAREHVEDDDFTHVLESFPIRGEAFLTQQNKRNCVVWDSEEKSLLRYFRYPSPGSSHVFREVIPFDMVLGHVKRDTGESKAEALLADENTPEILAMWLPDDADLADPVTSMLLLLVNNGQVLSIDLPSGNQKQVKECKDWLSTRMRVVGEVPEAKGARTASIELDEENRISVCLNNDEQKKFQLKLKKDSAKINKLKLDWYNPLQPGVILFQEGKTNREAWKPASPQTNAIMDFLQHDKDRIKRLIVVNSELTSEGLSIPKTCMDQVTQTLEKQSNGFPKTTHVPSLQEAVSMIDVMRDCMPEGKANRVVVWWRCPHEQIKSEWETMKNVECFFRDSREKLLVTLLLDTDHVEATLPELLQTNLLWSVNSPGANLRVPFQAPPIKPYLTSKPELIEQFESIVKQAWEAHEKKPIAHFWIENWGELTSEKTALQAYERACSPDLCFLYVWDVK